ncbi:transcriptional regulator with XRE-family HTH domain [Streptomyces sp. CZ24]|uniref:helix-turn-helix domain-containing protein n=1 Tax=Streptomyces TaxID=1883 RepID=UPI001EE4B865|nr:MULTISPECIES: XRE family transcriptional regulator [Streptomyces]MCG5118331.1 XRE family transcriptional regulator [Streptomyces sp. T7(2022)]MCR0986424.1 XRE family transcriptional regulator [Streptomyces albidoflavus]MDH6191342.1 transcriptional regulator with XRE-family HTH domain [Streptomyces sp. CZ24]
MSGELPLECAHLARELAGLRATTGLSLAGLAARTTASKSSWQRYLGGTQIPPPELVTELCALAGEPPARLLALRELAELSRRHPPSRPEPSAPPTPPAPAEPSQETGPATGEEPPAAGTPDAGRPHAPPAEPAPVPFFRRRKVALAGAGALATAAMVAGALLLGGAGEEPEDSGLWPGCVGERCRGKDSQSQGCGLKGSGMRTAAEREFGRQTVVELRYSPSCRASWVRVRFGAIGDRIEITGPDEESQSAEVADKFDAQNYLPTPMLAGGPEGMTACLVRAGSGERHCFGR